MSLTKLVVLGGLGYLAYRFISDLPALQGADHSSDANPGRSSHPMQRQGAAMTGGSDGMPEKTEELSGESASHRVGRGVIHQ